MGLNAVVAQRAQPGADSFALLVLSGKRVDFGRRSIEDFRSTGRAVTVVLTGWIVYLLLLAIF
jgi:hypothetical protein